MCISIFCELALCFSLLEYFPTSLEYLFILFRFLMSPGKYYLPSLHRLGWHHFNKKRQSRKDFLATLSEQISNDGKKFETFRQDTGTWHKDFGALFDQFQDLTKVS